MTELIYIDSNVYLDYLLNRKDRLRPLGNFAFELIRQVISCKYEILISEFLLEEIENHADKDKIDKLFTSIQKKSKKVETKTNDIKKAKEISYENRWDALHYILAKRGGAELIVTRNVEHFDFSDLQVVFPENL